MHSIGLASASAAHLQLGLCALQSQPLACDSSFVGFSLHPETAACRHLLRSRCHQWESEAGWRIIPCSADPGRENLQQYQ